MNELGSSGSNSRVAAIRSITLFYLGVTSRDLRFLDLTGSGLDLLWQFDEFEFTFRNAGIIRFFFRLVQE